MIKEYLKPDIDQEWYWDVWDFLVKNPEMEVTEFIEGGKVFEFWKKTLPQKIEEKGQMADNFGKVYDKPRNIYTNDVYTNEGELVKDVKQGKNFGYKHEGKPLKSTKGTSQIDYFAKNGKRVQLIGIAKHAGTFFDFVNVLAFAAKDNEEAQSGAMPVPTALGIVTAPIIEHAKAGWDEATDAAIQQDLEEKYKPRGLEGIREFVRDFGEFQGYKLVEISIDTADKMMLGDFTTMDELDSYNQKNFNIDGDTIYVLYREQDNPNEGNNMTIIETIIIKE